MAGIAALYLYDSALLLFHNEIVFELRRGGCRVSGGSVMELRGRHLFVPHPCCPQRALVRLTWSPDGPSGSGTGTAIPRRLRMALAAIAPWTWALLSLFFAGLPCVLWFGTNASLLIWLLLTYLVIGAMLWRVYRHRRALNLSRRDFAALAFDALLCAPFAINVVRKISLRQRPSISLRGMASSTLSPAETAALSAILRRKIEMSLGFLEPGTERSDGLIAYLKHFEGGQS